MKQIQNYVQNVSTEEDIIDTYKHIKEKYVERYTKIEDLFRTRINLFHYYESDTVFQQLVEKGIFLPENIDKTKEIIKYIETNNETTLIGTLNFMNFTTIFNSHDMVPICCEPSFSNKYQEEEQKDNELSQNHTKQYIDLQKY